MIDVAKREGRQAYRRRARALGGKLVTRANIELAQALGVLASLGVGQPARLDDNDLVIIGPAERALLGIEEGEADG